MTKAPRDEASGSGHLVVVGRIVGVYGVRGWVKVLSYTEPRDNLFAYRPWRVQLHGQWRSLEVVEGRGHGKGLVAHLAGVDSREQAYPLGGADIVVERDRLPATAADEYYWSDLIGLTVVNEDGVVFGTVDHLFETGANDVMVVEGDRQRLLPYIYGAVVKEVDLAHGRMRVDWPADF